MRRSGITSRAKWASFSISQTSCNNAGPRGPAVWMLRLSVTGVPDAWASGGRLDSFIRLLRWCETLRSRQRDRSATRYSAFATPFADKLRLRKTGFEWNVAIRFAMTLALLL